MTRARRAWLVGLALPLLGCAQDFSVIKVDLLGKDFTFTEGPAWSKDGYLIFSDTPSDRLLKWSPSHPIEVFRKDAHGPSGNAFDAQGRLYTCETRTRRVTRTEKSGAVEVLAERWDGKRFNAPNDVVVSKSGHVYFTDPAFGYQSDQRELDFYGVYHIPPKGPIQVVSRPAGRPNGIALAANGRTLYVVNTDERNVRAYDVDRNGETSGERVVVAKIASVPGGIRVDEKGELFVAAADGIEIYSPDGRLLHTIEIHGGVSNCAFGEADLMSLLITQRGNVYRARMDVKGAY
jgi:gluconolactonase